MEDEDATKVIAMTLLAEGDKLYNNGQIDKALDFYTQALVLQPGHKHGLVSRSKCYLRNGNVEAALTDAEQSLASDKSFFRGLYQKAEALYQKGDFEMSLVFYHRGHKLRPELVDFSLGIEKAQEAIVNSVGAPRVKFGATSKSDNLKPTTPSTQRRASRAPKANVNSSFNTNSKDDKSKAQNSSSGDGPTSQKVQKTLLRELYVDKEYLERLEQDNDLMKSCIDIREKLFVHDLVSSGINYLTNKTEFWRQQCPLYARKLNVSNISPASDPVTDTLKKISDMEAEECTEDYKKAITLAEDEICRIERCTEKQLQQAALKAGSPLVHKQELMCELYLAAGNAALNYFARDNEDEGAFEKAEKYFDRVHTVIQAGQRKSKGPLQTRVSQDHHNQALERLGRLYVLKDDLQKAISTWEKREALITNQKEELVVLYHDIGRAYLTMGNKTKANEYANLSYSMVVDQVWKMNVMVLMAEIHLAAKEIDQAKRVLENCLTIAREEKDHGAEKAVYDLLERLRVRV